MNNVIQVNFRRANTPSPVLASRLSEEQALQQFERTLEELQHKQRIKAFITAMTFIAGGIVVLMVPLVMDYILRRS